jgi:hypothetical protein
MNEIELIRSQLALQRQRVSTVANACAAALGRAATGSVTTNPPPSRDFLEACVDYLACVLAWFEERDQRLADLARAEVRPEDGPSRALQEALARPGRSREALEKLEAAFARTAAGFEAGSAQSWPEFAQYFNSVWSARRDAIDALLARSFRVADWRAVGGVDADSIFEERRRYARVCATLPAGVTLAAPPSAAG